MRAIVLKSPGGTDQLAVTDVPNPTAGAGQIRVRVAAFGLNRADLLQRRGSYPAPPGWPSDILGLEYAGLVDAVGEGVTRWRIGDRVMGLVGGGGYAEAVVVHESEAMPVPLGLSLVEAAAVPEAFLTAYDALFTRGRLGSGERVLIHAVGSGVGTAAVQLAKRIGATVLGTSRTADKLDRCKSLGLDQGIATADRTFREQLPIPVDVIIDPFGGGAFADNLAVLAPKGRLVMIGFLQGAEYHGSLELILRKRLEVVGTVMRTRPLAERAALVQEFGERALPILGGAIRPIVGATYPAAAIADGHQAMEANAVFGKIVMTW